MKHHRFYIPPDKRELRHSLWIDDQTLVKQWRKVLRFKEGDELVLFDGLEHERLYRVEVVEELAYKLAHVTDLEHVKPKRHVYLIWSLLKKDKNDWVIQKCTELGVSNFVPVLSVRTENNQFDLERAERIAIEAVEQCGRSDIPTIHEPVDLKQALGMYTGKIELYVADPEAEDSDPRGEEPAGVLVGPEGGWSPEELDLIHSHEVKPMSLGNLILRAETAAVIASGKLLQ